jgi:hypothetical protein
MTPILFSLAGLAVIILCVIILKKTGGALFRRRLREAAEADKKRFESDDTVG